MISSGRSSGHVWNLGQLIAYSMLQNGTDKGQWYRRADLAYSKLQQYKYGNTGAYYIVRNYYNPALRVGYANYSGWQEYNLLTGYFITRAGQLYDSSVIEQPTDYLNFNDFNSSDVNGGDSGYGVLNNGNYSIYQNAMYVPSPYATNGYNNGSQIIPSRFIITWENAANVTIYPNPQDMTYNPSTDDTNFDYFNGGSSTINLSSINRTNISTGVGTSTIWHNMTNITYGGYSVGYINKSATINNNIIHLKNIYGGLDGRLINFRSHLVTLINDNRTVATKTVNGLSFNYSKGNESFNVTNITMIGGSGLAVANSGFDGYGEFGHHNSTLIYGNTTSALSHWGFDEGTGSTASDSNTTSANTGTLTGTNWQLGHRGYAANFTSPNDVNINANITGTTKSYFYLGGWVKLDSSAPISSAWFSNWNDAITTDRTYLIRWQKSVTPNALNVIFQNSSNAATNVNYRPLDSNGNLTDGNWHWVEVFYNSTHVSVSYDFVQSPNVTAWVGLLDSSVTATRIGLSPHSLGGNGWGGKIDDTYYCDCVPTLAERQAFSKNEVILEYDFQGQTSNVYGYQMTQLPAVQSYSPETPVTNNVSESRTFSVTFTKTVNVTWFINGTQVQTNNSVTSASYTNLSAVLGNWSVNATGVNDYGSATQLWNWTVLQESVPPASITSPQTTTGNFYINNTWTDPTDIDFDHVSFYHANGTWLQNVTAGVQFLNLTYSPHYTQNISAQTVDASGNINTTKVWFNTTIPNNPITISGVNASYSFTEGQYLTIDANYSDPDSDTGTFADNSTAWNVNTTTGIVNWTAVVGNYNWYINVSDGYGNTSTQNFTVTVSSGVYVPPTPTNLYQTNSSTCFWINYT